VEHDDEAVGEFDLSAAGTGASARATAAQPAPSPAILWQPIRRGLVIPRFGMGTIPSTALGLGPKIARENCRDFAPRRAVLRPRLMSVQNVSKQQSGAVIPILLGLRPHQRLVLSRRPQAPSRTMGAQSVRHASLPGCCSAIPDEPLARPAVSRNSRPARSVSAYNTGRSCRHCIGLGKSRAGQNSASRRRTHNTEVPGRCTRGDVRGAPSAAPQGPA
jgi:hypothetical protein